MIADQPEEGATIRVGSSDLIANRTLSARNESVYVFAAATLLVVSRLIYSDGSVLASGANLVALVLLPVTFAVTRRETLGRRAAIISVILLWLLALVVCDLVNGEGFGGLTGEVISVGLAILAYMTFRWLLETVGLGKTLGLLAGIVALGVPQAVESNPVALENPWKYGLGLAATLLALASTAKYPRRGIGMLVALAVLSLILDSRGIAAILIISVLVTLVSRQRGKGIGRQATLVTGGLVLATFLAYGYTTLAGTGNLGQNAQLRYETQVQSKTAAESLAIVRPEIVSAVSMLSERPLFGFGTSGEPTFGERSRAMGVLASNGYEPSEAEVYRLIGSRVNAHSLVISQWVNAGILGILLAAWLLVALWVKAWRRGSTSVPAVTFLLVWLTWGALTSPWAPGTEWVFGGAIAIFVWQLGQDAETSRVVE